MKESTLVAIPATTTSTVAVMDCARTLNIPLQPFGHSHAPIVPQRLGDWWMDLLQPSTAMPARARQRLDTLLAAGVRPRATVIFHEIPVHVPEKREPESASQHRQSVLDLICFGVKFGASTVRNLRKALVPTQPTRRDPCLAIVTEDGTWLEVDRWFV